MKEMAAAALFTVLADENVMIPAAKMGTLRQQLQQGEARENGNIL